MPIEINEVVIRVSVEEPKTTSSADASSAPGAASSAKSSDRAVEEILQILRDKQER